MATAVNALSILVADDEEGIRNLLVHWLQRQGHSVSAVGGATEAVSLLNEHRFDLVITDIVMPGGDGFELIAAFRKAQPAARIVAISGGGKYLQGSDCLKIARGLGANAAVMKPFKWEELQAGIDLALSQSDAGLV
jgi:two-component system chemotaxis response regulator CheY